MTGARCYGPSGSTSDGAPVAALPADASRCVVVGFDRFAGWLDRYQGRHPEAQWVVDADQVSGSSPDGALIHFAVPFGPLTQQNGLDSVLTHLARPWQIGVLLVRRGGFAVAHAVGPEPATVKIGQRHVQGRTKAGGWSQHRFSRRRENQARAAFEAAGEHAARILAPLAQQLDVLVIGGDRAAVGVVLERPDLRPLAAVRREWQPVSGDPRREALERVLAATRSVTVELRDPL